MYDAAKLLHVPLACPRHLERRCAPEGQYANHGAEYAGIKLCRWPLYGQSAGMPSTFTSCSSHLRPPYLHCDSRIYSDIIMNSIAMKGLMALVLVAAYVNVVAGKAAMFCFAFRLQRHPLMQHDVSNWSPLCLTKRRLLQVTRRSTGAALARRSSPSVHVNARYCCSPV